MARRPPTRPDPLTPEQHEARIAELRARRRVRAKMLARRSAFIGLGLTLLIVVVVWWLLGTIGGRDFLLAQIAARLPPGSELTWTRVEGPASGPMTVHGLHLLLPRQRDPTCEPTPDASCATGDIVFDATRVVLDPALRPLLGRTLRLDALQVAGATLELPETDAPFDLPRWPDSLPRIAPPLQLQADDVRVEGLAVTRAGAPLIDITRLRGGVDARNGALHVERLVVDSDRGRFTAHGDYAPGDDYRTDLTATAVLPARAGRTPARLGLVARGDLADMQVALAGAAPGPLRATLVLRGRDAPRWQLRANAAALDLGLLADPAAEPTDAPLALALTADGTGGTATLQGRVAQGDFSATILPSRLRLEDQVLDVQPLALQLLDGRATLRGHADFRDPDDASFRFAVNARGLRWGGGNTGADATPAIRADADLGLAGTLERWALIGEAALARGDARAQVRLDGRGHADGMTLRTLHAQMPTGTLDATGTVAWAPTLGWDLDARLAGFDPGYFAAGWDGAVDGRLASTGSTRADGGLEAVLDVADLGGRLRGRPLDGRGHFTLHGAPRAGGTTHYEGELALTLGNSRIDAEGRVGAALAVDATFAPLHLADLWPDAAGTLRGTVELRGARGAPDLAADLDGSGLQWDDYRADTLSLRGQLPWVRGNGTLAVRGSGLQLGIALDTLAIDARGAVAALQLDAQARGELGALALAGRAGKQGDSWQGTLASLQLTPARGAQWTLRDPAQWRWTTPPNGASHGTLASSCLASSAGGSLCASAQWPTRGLAVAGQGLPLSLLLPYLPERGDGRPWLLRGEVALEANLRPVGNAWQGQATLASASGGLKFSERAQREVVRFEALSLRATFDPQRIQADLGAVLNDDGRIDARVATGWDGYAPLAGEIALQTDELTWMELLSPDIVEPTGNLSGRITLGGTRAQPALGGQARLTGFSTQLPALAITLVDGNLQLDAQPDGSARIAGSVRSGEGVLDIDGTLGWQGDFASGQSRPLVLNVRGDNVLVSDTRDLHAIASPDLVVRAAAGQPLEITGTVTVPEARIDLERLDQGVSVSPDVVVLDPVETGDDGIATPAALDLTLIVGEDVTLSGFGLDGTLDGRLRVRARPGREMTASGNLAVAGRYTAYGQRLQIVRGDLSWSNDPVSDPVLDIRAQRQVGAVTAGVDVRGRASAPRAEVWSNPASSQSEALAYLALGRPLSTTSGDERSQLNAASAALSAGSSMIASQLAANIGLDDAGVVQSRALGGSVFGVGKYLSPRLYVGYGVSLLGTGQVLTLKYLLGRGFDIEVESSSVENRASVNWRIEK